MKPLRRAPLTDEDWAVWLRFENRPGFYGYSGYVESDRRDAELMSKLVRTRTGNPADHLIRATYGLPFWDIEAIVSGWLA